MPTIVIDLPRPSHQYEIVLEPGLGQRWREEIEARIPADRYIAAVDSRLAGIHSLPPSGATTGRWRYLHVEAGEANKTFGQYRRLCGQALAGGIDRDSVAVALGGGVVGDLVGFMASTLLRGIRLVQVPTTLLAQVDSSVGGKNGIDTPAGKNLIGTFHQPELVLVDPGFLDTLPRREYLAGLAEVVKTAILDSPGFFAELRENIPGLRAGDHAFLAGVIARCCRVKADIVASDERDRGRRALLNLGHTFGHALESLAGYDGGVIHGEAVAVGMALAAEFSFQEGILPDSDRRAILALLDGLDLPAAISRLGLPGLDAEKLAIALLGDKKNSGGKVNLVLPHAIGDCRLEKGFPAPEIAGFMSRLRQEP